MNRYEIDTGASKFGYGIHKAKNGDLVDYYELLELLDRLDQSYLVDGDDWSNGWHEAIDSIRRILGKP